MNYTTAIDIDAPPATVWGVMRDVERWHEWTASITSVRLDRPAPLAVGHRASIRQPRLPPAKWEVTSVESGRGFTWVARSPGVLVTARHAIEPLGGGKASRVTLSLDYEGLLGPLIGRLTRGVTHRYLALEAEGLKRRSEGEGAVFAT